MARSPKPETDDPVASLDDKSIHVRAAAARDLSQFGTPEHLPLLIERAHQDRSPAVRLGCAGAASDILSRLRLPPAREQLSLAQRRDLVEHFRGFDPAVNSGLFPILACLGLPDLFTRIAAGLRDPRGDVRLGGAVGLLRMVSSAAVAGDDLMEKRVVSLLSDTRLTPDAIASVAKVCAAVGYRSALPVLYRLDLPGAHGDVVSDAIDTFEAMSAPLEGAWFSDGRDAGEVNPHSPQGHAFVFIQGDRALHRSPDGTWATCDDFGANVRRMFIRQVGTPAAVPAFQRSGRTWYQASNPDILQCLETEIAGHPVDGDHAAEIPPDPILGQLATCIATHAEDSAALWRDLGKLRVRAGDLPGAVSCLQNAIAGKRTPADTWLYLGEVLHAQGQTTQAREMWCTCTEKARSQKADYFRRAQARLSETG